VTGLLAAVGLGVGAAVLLGIGFVLQQRMARLLPARDALSPRLFLDLVRKPPWLAGIAAMVAGQLLGAGALGAGGVTLIEPLLTTNLLFALLFSRLLSTAALRGQEWVGAVALVAGVVVFLVCAAPTEAPDAVAATGGRAAAVFLAAVAVVVAALVLLARRRLGPVRASMLAVGAGLLFGMQDGLTRGVVGSLGDGPARLFASWTSYALVAGAIIGILLMQSAFEAAPLHTSLPVITAVEPLTGIGYGIGVYGEQVQVGPGWVFGEVVGLVVMIVGVVLVASSHTLHLRGRL
jgi:drug/metabolite transporter (DMT)-like permease